MYLICIGIAIAALIMGMAVLLGGLAVDDTQAFFDRLADYRRMKKEKESLGF